MNRSRLEQLATLLPEDAGIFTSGRQPGAAPPSLAERLSAALRDPGFGHKFIMHYVEHSGEPFPASVFEPWLRRAQSHYAGENLLPDPVLIQVEQLALPASEFTRHVLNALLASRDISFAQIAEHLGLDEQVILAYEQLHFNVRDRAADKTYISRLALPEGRFQSLRTDGVEEMTIEARLLVAGYTHGAQEVLWLAGMVDQNPPSAERALKSFEDALVNNALQLARAGALNSKSAPGIAHGKSLLVARRDSESAKNPAPVGQSDISLSDAILLSMPRTKAGAERATAAADARMKEHEKFFREHGVGL